MYLDGPPRLIETKVFSARPDAFRRKGVRNALAEANRPGQPTDCCTNVAIGGANRDRLYATESATGTVLVADIGELNEHRREVR